ncbi:MAG TPA: peptide chain release factor N(5)-glutamine methyltransferase [Rhizobacter sp.]|nr:peptide chain release factor N(5)-glutamine methyltransferase [Rhizobacter sp.]
MAMTETHALHTRCAELAAHLQLLPDKPQETVQATLHVLWHLAAGLALSVEAAAETPLPELDAVALARLDGWIAQRVSGIPLAHLSGRQRFMGLEMLAGKEALIPRHETELLGYAALDLLRGLAAAKGSLRVVDVCTGSGNLALALAHHEPKARVWASDLSEEAVELAARNGEHLGLSGRVQWRAGDLLEPFDQPEFHGAVDLLVCNPPYISSGKVDTMASEISGFEPRLAFDGGPLGVRILQKLIREAPRYLAPDGWLAFEVGLGQGPAVLKRLQASGGFAQQRTVSDAQGEMRVILASGMR